MTQKILVTGGSGFIGSNIVRKLISNNFNVLVIDDLSSGKKEYIEDCLKENSKCQFINGSITDMELLIDETKDIDVIIHEAANPDVRASKENLFSFFEINVKGTLNILNAMVNNEITKIIFASSCGTVYGETEILPTPENQPLNPISHYGASKAASENYLSSFSSLYGIEAISLRLGNIYGPPSNHGVIYDFYQKLKKNPKKLEILGDGKQTKSYLYIEDCIEAHLKALEKSFVGHQKFNITTSEAITVNQIAETVVDTLGLKEVEFSYTGGKRGWAGDVSKAISDNTKAKEVLDWEPRISIKEGIKLYFSWLEQQEKTKAQFKKQN